MIDRHITAGERAARVFEPSKGSLSLDRFLNSRLLPFFALHALLISALVLVTETHYEAAALTLSAYPTLFLGLVVTVAFFFWRLRQRQSTQITAALAFAAALPLLAIADPFSPLAILFGFYVLLFAYYRAREGLSFAGQVAAYLLLYFYALEGVADELTLVTSLALMTPMLLAALRLRSLGSIIISSIGLFLVVLLEIAEQLDDYRIIFYILLASLIVAFLFYEIWGARGRASSAKRLLELAFPISFIVLLFSLIYNQLGIDDLRILSCAFAFGVIAFLLVSEWLSTRTDETARRANLAAKAVIGVGFVWNAVSVAALDAVGNFENFRASFEITIFIAAIFTFALAFFGRRIGNAFTLGAARISSIGMMSLYMPTALFGGHLDHGSPASIPLSAGLLVLSYGVLAYTTAQTPTQQSIPWWSGFLRENHASLLGKLWKSTKRIFTGLPLTDAMGALGRGFLNMIRSIRAHHKAFDLAGVASLAGHGFFTIGAVDMSLLAFGSSTDDPALTILISLVVVGLIAAGVRVRGLLTQNAGLSSLGVVVFIVSSIIVFGYARANGTPEFLFIATAAVLVLLLARIPSARRDESTEAGAETSATAPDSKSHARSLKGANLETASRLDPQQVAKDLNLAASAVGAVASSAFERFLTTKILPFVAFHSVWMSYIAIFPESAGLEIRETQWRNYYLVILAIGVVVSVITALAQAASEKKNMASLPAAFAFSFSVGFIATISDGPVIGPPVVAAFYAAVFLQLIVSRQSYSYFGQALIYLAIYLVMDGQGNLIISQPTKLLPFLAMASAGILFFVLRAFSGAIFTTLALLVLAAMQIFVAYLQGISFGATELTIFSVIVLGAALYFHLIEFVKLDEGGSTFRYFTGYGLPAFAAALLVSAYVLENPQPIHLYIWAALVGGYHLLTHLVSGSKERMAGRILWVGLAFFLALEIHHIWSLERFTHLFGRTLNNEELSIDGPGPIIFATLRPLLYAAGALILIRSGLRLQSGFLLTGARFVIAFAAAVLCYHMLYPPHGIDYSHYVLVAGAFIVPIYWIGAKATRPYEVQAGVPWWHGFLEPDYADAMSNVGQSLWSFAMRIPGFGLIVWVVHILLNFIRNLRGNKKALDLAGLSSLLLNFSAFFVVYAALYQWIFSDAWLAYQETLIANDRQESAAEAPSNSIKLFGMNFYYALALYKIIFVTCVAVFLRIRGNSENNPGLSVFGAFIIAAALFQVIFAPFSTGAPGNGQPGGLFGLIYATATSQIVGLSTPPLNWLNLFTAAARGSEGLAANLFLTIIASIAVVLVGGIGVRKFNREEETEVGEEITNVGDTKGADPS